MNLNSYWYYIYNQFCSFLCQKLIFVDPLCRTSSAIMVFRQAITTGLLPSSDVLSQVLGCLRFPHDGSLKNTFIDNMGISCDMPHHPNTNSLLEGFGEYDIRAFSVLEVGMLSFY